MASRWEGVRLPRASGKSPDFHGSSPNFPGSFSATSPEVLSLWNLTAIQGFPGSFPDFPGSSPDFPGSSPDFPGDQPLSLGSLTPSPDSQKLSLIFCSSNKKLGRLGAWVWKHDPESQPKHCVRSLSIDSLPASGTRAGPQNPHHLTPQEFGEGLDSARGVAAMVVLLCSRTHPSSDVIFFGQISAKKRQKVFLYMTSGSLENKHFWHHVM